MSLQGLRPHPGLTVSESPFSQDPQVIRVHIKVWESLRQVTYLGVKQAWLV